MAVLVVSRPEPWRGSWRAVRIVLDGKKIARIRRGQRVSISLPPGRHRLQVRADLLRSASLEFELRPGEEAAFICRVGIGVPIRWLTGPALERRHYLELRRIH
jgi:hypothetical protein